MMWYQWNSKEDFNLWHDAAKEYLGLPKQGINAATGELEEHFTTDAVKSIEVNVNDIRANVPTELAESLPENLGVPSENPVPDLPWLSDDQA